MYVCSHIENMICFKLATCISWAVFGGTIGGQHRQVSLYSLTLCNPFCYIRLSESIDNMDSCMVHTTDGFVHTGSF
jgi:hypothetical protein